MPQLDHTDDTVWNQDSTPVFPDLDSNGERAARATYSRDKNSWPRTEGGYATCYRCSSSASMFVQLRVSSLTPVCKTHLEDLQYAKDSYGTMAEAGPYLG